MGPNCFTMKHNYFMLTGTSKNKMSLAVVDNKLINHYSLDSNIKQTQRTKPNFETAFALKTT